MNQPLRAQLAAHRLKRPKPAMKFRDMTPADFAEWQRTHATWMTELERLTCAVTCDEHPVDLSRCRHSASPALVPPSPRFRR